MARVYHVLRDRTRRRPRSGTRIRDFQRPAQVASARFARAALRMREPADKVGCVSGDFNLQNGDRISVSNCSGLSDYDLFYSYSMLEGPMPRQKTTSPRLRLTPVTEGDRTFIRMVCGIRMFDPENEDDLD